MKQFITSYLKLSEHVPHPLLRDCCGKTTVWITAVSISIIVAELFYGCDGDKLCLVDYRRVDYAVFILEDVALMAMDEYVAICVFGAPLFRKGNNSACHEVGEDKAEQEEGEIVFGGFHYFKSPKLRGLLIENVLRVVQIFGVLIQWRSIHPQPIYYASPILLLLHLSLISLFPLLLSGPLLPLDCHARGIGRTIYFLFVSPHQIAVERSMQHCLFLPRGGVELWASRCICVVGSGGEQVGLGKFHLIIRHYY